MKIALIPIDNRPVCYSLPKQIIDCTNDYQLFLPERSLLGDLEKIADIDAIYEWLKNLENVDYIVVSLDTLAYGGLIPSRRSPETYDDIKLRLQKLKNILKEKNAKILGCSSIMRISNNNYNEEEKEYWSKFGKKIFDYSFNFHKSECVKDFNSKAKFECISNVIPQDILDDYLQTRKRNFEINKLYLEWLKEGLISELVFSKDDCAQYGFNVKEAGELEKIITKENLNALIKTGADEIPLSLLSRVLTENQKINVAIKYTQPETIDKISKYEDVSVENSVKSQLALANLNITNEEDADLILLVNNFNVEQGEIVMGISEKGFDKDFELPQKTYFIADILNANGADNEFVKTLFTKKLGDNFCGYAAWNTTGNTLGSVIAIAVAKFLNKKPDEFKKVQFVRFMDDWAYQANVRQELKLESSDINKDLLKEKMKKYENIVNEKLNTNFSDLKYDFPWKRYFEVEVDF